MAVRDHHLTRGHGGDGFAGGLVVGVIPARKPVAVENTLALRPDLGRAMRIIAAGIDKRQPGFGKAVIDNAQPQPAARRISPREPDLQAARRQTEIESPGRRQFAQGFRNRRGIGRRRAAGRARRGQGYAVNRQPHAVQIKAAEMVVEGNQRDRLGAHHLAPPGVKPQPQLIVQHVISRTGRPLPAVRASEAVVGRSSAHCLRP